MELISVIIPSYNHFAFIKKAVQSVLNQTYQNFELIVIDDGSTDNSLLFLKTINDKRFRLIEQQNLGAHTAINRGLSLSNGNFFSILNSDDIFYENRLKVCYDVANLGYDLVSSWIEIIDQNDNLLDIKKGWKNLLPWPIASDTNFYEFKETFEYNIIFSNFVSTTSNIFFSRKLYNLIGGMRNFKFTHDWDFLLRASAICKCKLIDQPLLKYRVHSNNTINSNKQLMIFEILLIWVIHFHKNISILVKQINEKVILNNFINNSISRLNFQENKTVYILLKLFADIYNNINKKNNFEKFAIGNNELINFFVKKINT
jgi:glycosyltransferase involved in cell wall biosynthesis